MTSFDMPAMFTTWDHLIINDYTGDTHGQYVQLCVDFYEKCLNEECHNFSEGQNRVAMFNPH